MEKEWGVRHVADVDEKKREKNKKKIEKNRTPPRTGRP
jgi:hypothetical protein